MFAKTTSRDLGLALIVTLGGGAVLLSALRASWNPQDLSLGVESCLTTTVVGFLLALLHPLPYGRVLALCAPLVAVEYWSCTYAAGSAVGRGIVGTQLVIMGFVGLALTLRERRPAAAPEAVRAPCAAPRPASSHA